MSAYQLADELMKAHNGHSDEGPTTFSDAAELLRTQAARIAELEKIEVRYNWLRSRVPGGTYRVMGIIYSEGGEGVDAGIDAAIAGEAT
jgi:hypothetical protein